MQARPTTVNRIVIVIILLLLALLIGGLVTYRSAAQAVRDDYFMAHEIILVGTTTNLDALIQELQTIDPNIQLTLDPNRSFSLQTLQQSTQQSLGPQTIVSAALQVGSGDSACTQLSAELEINLYQLTGSTDDVEAVLDAIDQTAAGGNVLADANWIIGEPWHPTGSPLAAMPSGSDMPGWPVTFKR